MSFTLIRLACFLRGMKTPWKNHKEIMLRGDRKTHFKNCPHISEITVR
ncbi:hypothetical protein CES85_5706 [Ochrobactrum quorumnocens]|uniref:Uncharacterized protein n=1 Tax=Ochrobactrum quorumnocens TaxID=271865 RepID=A0A248UE61_9HYPH|nr:hypothetical protein CES85_5654 [[Ochrobactrum] quorumnocens]ASV84902.1 hypothetical protein CES85_5706 [[Ochrobactrum] quorumnocens]